MKLYHWQSKCLKNWADGDIIAMAKTEEEAREKVLSKIKCFMIENVIICNELDDEEVEKKMNEIREDIAVPAGIVDTIFITGSQ